MRISERRIKQIINEETRRALREADIKGGSFAVKPGYKLPADLKSGDRLPADMFDEPSMSPEEGPGARAAMRMRKPEIVSVGDPNFLKGLSFLSDEDKESMLDYAHASGGRAPEGMEGEFDDSYDEDEDLDADEDEDEDEDSEGEDEEPYDSDMGLGGGDEDSEGDVDPDEDSDDPFYSGGHRVKEQRSLNFRSIVKEETLKFLRSRR